MKAIELMIGDWAKFKESKYPHKRGELICIKNHNEFELSYKLVPIPLTEEILKANGFEVCYNSPYQTKYDLWSFDKKNCVECKFSKQSAEYNYLRIFIDGGERVCIPIEYVHELQHALRLCGLNDLADNFKQPYKN